MSTPDNNSTAVQSATGSQNESGTHRLQSTWTFWFDKKNKSKNVSYADNLINTISFSTIEDFWRSYVHLVKASVLPKEANIHLFRSGLTPMWETFPKGGCHIKKVRKGDPNLTVLWEELMVALIGEAFEDPDVVGIVLSIRQKEDVISVWNADCCNFSLRPRLNEVLKSVWGAENCGGIEYKTHNASMKDRSTYRTRGNSVDVVAAEKVIAAAENNATEKNGSAEKTEEKKEEEKEQPTAGEKSG
ncbi:putative Eukaryotic translation initiation factor 4E type [Planoprotostelium fungivorum]|uniref:Putative Eukaryotic translation initiation factor 4E type n=1 Tax=Planoprotostelium fungivorum TaxID=1890364 RepID=A0A2P6N6L9_9EUKA|nr:putative Eukaryotic translation initiation factor 4E type [Planoprotostelium fungivorum]